MSISAAARRLADLARREPVRALAAYYVVTGVWPIVHLRSFMALTGRKTDTWLVQTFGAFIAATGATLLPRAQSEDGRRVQANVAAAAAAALAASEAYFVAKRRISPIYLGDAVVEIALFAAIAAANDRDAETTPGPP